MQKLLLFIILPFFIYSYEFKYFQIGPIFSYRQDEFDFSIRSPLIADPNATRENFNTFHVFEIGVNTELIVPYRIFIRGKSLWGFGSTSHAILEARRQVFDLNDSFVSEQRFQNKYDAKSYTLDTSINIGMPIKFCPITFLAYFGYGYDRENIIRKNPPISDFTSENLRFIFRPSKHLNFKFYSPLFGIGFHLHPNPCGIFKLISEYQYYWGILNISSSYQSQIIDLSNFIIEKENLKLKAKGYSHRFFIQLLFNLRCHLNFGMMVKYQYTSANPKDINQTIMSKELSSNNFIQQSQLPFNKFVWQYLGGEVLLSMQF